MVFQYWKGTYKQKRDLLFTRMDSDRTRKNVFKLREGRFRLDIRRKFFSQRLVTHWNRLPKEVVDALSLDAFKARLDVRKNYFSERVVRHWNGLPREVVE